MSRFNSVRTGVQRETSAPGSVPFLRRSRCRRRRLRRAWTRPASAHRRAAAAGLWSTARAAPRRCAAEPPVQQGAENPEPLSCRPSLPSGPSRPPAAPAERPEHIQHIDFTSVQLKTHLRVWGSSRRDSNQHVGIYFFPQTGTSSTNCKAACKLANVGSDLRDWDIKHVLDQINLTSISTEKPLHEDGNASRLCLCSPHRGRNHVLNIGGGGVNYIWPWSTKPVIKVICE